MFGEQGHPVRATVSDMGPLLLARMLALNETQAGVLNLVFKIADDNGLLLLDLKDLRAMLQHVGDNASAVHHRVRQRQRGQHRRHPARAAADRANRAATASSASRCSTSPTSCRPTDGQGVVNILAADKLMNAPRLYATFLLWMLSELFEQLPEVGDLDKPKLVFFFDEAHLLFNDAPKALVERIELVVRLVRSKGVGVYFVTQNPLDIPDTVLAQLGNRVQHALRAFTPRDQKAVKAAASTMRANPGPGHRDRHHRARGGRGAGQLPRREGPAQRDRARLRAAAGQPDRADHARAARGADRRARWSPASTRRRIDRESAYEKLKGRAAASGEAAQADRRQGARAARQPRPSRRRHARRTEGHALRQHRPARRQARGPGRDGRVARPCAASARRSGREIVRGVLGGLLGGSKRR